MQQQKKHLSVNTYGCSKENEWRIARETGCFYDDGRHLDLFRQRILVRELHSPRLRETHNGLNASRHFVGGRGISVAKFRKRLKNFSKRKTPPRRQRRLAVESSSSMICASPNCRPAPPSAAARGRWPARRLCGILEPRSKLHAQQSLARDALPAIAATDARILRRRDKTQNNRPTTTASIPKPSRKYRTRLDAKSLGGAEAITENLASTERAGGGPLFFMSKAVRRPVATKLTANFPCNS